MGNEAALRTGLSYADILRENALTPVNVLLVARCAWSSASVIC
ncbi:hypothetical protein BH24CHL5_BH24CHL5_06120 [soil metagenome]